VFENADGSKVQASTLVKLSSDLIAERVPPNQAPGEVSYLVLKVNPEGPSAAPPERAIEYAPIEITEGSALTTLGSVAITPTRGGSLIASLTLFIASTVSSTFVRCRVNGGDFSDALIEIVGVFAPAAINGIFPDFVISPVEPGIEYTVSITAEPNDGEEFFIYGGSKLIVQEVKSLS
jgi:hypothetical protein